MNFVTFNQDYSCLAVGKYTDPREEDIADVHPRDIQRLPNLSHRPFRKDIQQ
jgi:hypothetical protein